MRTTILICLVLVIGFVGKGQNSFLADHTTDYPIASQLNADFQPQSSSDGNSIGKFALSFDALGFIEFGPMLSAEFGLSDNFVLNIHSRFSSLGLLMRVVNIADGELPDKFSGIAFGGGVKYFFTDNESKPYLGMMAEYGWDKSLHDEGGSYEWENSTKYFALFVNGGYRFRFPSGFFINTGVSFGAAILLVDEWYYTDEDYRTDDPYETDTHAIPFGMVEIAFGIEF